MRVSSNQILEAGVKSMENSLAEAMAWQKKISTGKNYSKASDNPYAVSRGVRLEFDIARLDMYKTNQNFVASSHAIAQTQMGTIIDELTVLKQAFVQSQNGALNSTNFKALKIQAEQIRDTIKAQSIAKDATGNAIFPETVTSVQIEPNLTVDSGVRFSDLSGNYLNSTATDQYDLSSLNLASGDTVKIGTVTFTASEDTTTTGSSLATQFVAYLNSGTAGSSGTFSNTGSGNSIANWAGTASANSGVLTLTASSTGSGKISSGNATTVISSETGSVKSIFTDGGVDETSSDLYQKINDFVIYLDERATGSSLTKTAGAVESGLDAIFDRITTAQQRSGGIAAQVDISKEAMGTIGTEMAATASALLDTDLAAATASYTRAQTLLNAAQAMFARLQQSSLFSKL
jgi:flagellin-like hook-associated protein FlgL